MNETNDEEITKEILEQRSKQRAKKKIKMPTCEVCKKNIAIGVFAVPSVPISCAYCEECVVANAHPWWILISNTACIGNLDKAAVWWKEMVLATCKHLGKTIEEFNADVAESLIRLNEYMQKDYEKHLKEEK